MCDAPEGVKRATPASSHRPFSPSLRLEVSGTNDGLALGSKKCLRALARWLVLSSRASQLVVVLFDANGFTSLSLSVLA